MYKFYKAFILFLILTHASYPQSQFIKFEHISVKDGLSNEWIQYITQDHLGFMWFATVDGLNKYDGYKITKYRYDPGDSTSLGNNNIRSIYEDASGNLWISILGGGLNKYNREKDNFIRYMPDPSNPESINSLSIEIATGSRENGKDFLWIGSGNGLYKMDIEKETFKYYSHTDKGSPYTDIETLIIDSSGNIWIGCSQGGIYKFNPDNEQFTHYQNNPVNPESLSDNTILEMMEDKSGMLWIATAFGGLNRFDPEKEKFIRYLHDPKNPQSLSGNYVLSLYEDKAGNLWIGTAEGGLNLLDRETGQFVSYQHDQNNPNSLSDNTVICIYEDISGVLWFGTWVDINKFNPRKNLFADYNQIPVTKKNLTNSFITAICESNHGGDNILWVAPKSGGIYRLNRTTGKFRHYSYDADNMNGIPSNRVQALLEDRDRMLWIGAWGDGLIKFNPETERFTRFMIYPNETDRSSLNIVRTIFQDKAGILWIGTHMGLFRFDPEVGQFTRIGDRTRTMQIYEDKNNDFWLATFSGLKKIDRESEEFTSFRYDPEDPYSISHDQVLCIYESSHEDEDVLWIGTDGGGLNKFHRRSGKFTSYTEKDGLPNNTINGILEDDSSNLWLSTNNGLSKFDPVKEKFRNYDVNDGLFSNQFYPGACYKSNNGALFFGSSKGLCAFYPEKLTDNPHVPEIVLTDFQIFNSAVAINKLGDTENNISYTIPKSVTLLDKVQLSYWQNVFSFEFAALDYWNPEKNQYAYILEGFDENWVYTDASRRFATYTNLNPGEYVFRVKGSNNDDIWNEEGTSIKVNITPPWWKTNWAYLSYFILLVGLFLSLRQYDLKRQRLKQQMKMERFEAEKLREVDKLKSHFFANISHEFRTPLTLIKGPVIQLLDGNFVGNIKEQYRMILRNSDRLLGLINQILDLSKLESGESKLKVTETDIVKYLKGLVLSFSSLAERKKITIKLNIQDQNITGFIDRDKFEKIFTNLLSNAFKFTPEGGMIEVLVFLTPLSSTSPLMNKGGTKGGLEGSIQISISNTGPGIPAGQLDKIFDRFYQADNNYKKDSEGTGIGLALTKELVEVCHGEISVASIPDKSTTFTITLPMAKENFREDEIVETIPLSSPLVRGDSWGGKETVQETTESEKSKPVSHSKKSAPLLLIVEDNPDVTSYISSFMENEYRIITAENGNEGLKLVLDQYPDLVISDVMMPEMDGFELCRKIKSDERISHVPVILLTAKADLESKIDGLEFGADDYVTKPFEARELQIRTKNLIEQRRKLREKFVKLIELQPKEITATSVDEEFLKRLMNVFENNISEPDFSTEQCAREVGMSRSSLNRKLQALTNQSTHEFIRSLRLKRAAQLLKKATGSVTEIAYSVGFNNVSHFSKIFRRQFGQLPRDFAKPTKPDKN